MTEQIFIAKGRAYPGGITVMEDGSINIAVSMEKENCGIIFYNGEEELSIAFDDSFCIGDLYCVNIKGIAVDQFNQYRFFDGDKIFVDSYAKNILGNETYGKIPAVLYGQIAEDDFDWEEDKNLFIPYSCSVIYQLHVRGFTRHSSSGVKHKGTFEGLVEKIPYLKDLGITAVELMPAYEFLEMERKIIEGSKLPMSYQEEEPVLNYWGYKQGFYFAPKNSYAAGSNPVYSFKTLVKEMHKNGVEVIMQFYFPDEITKAYIAEVLRFWVCEYHVDGFRLKGNRIPADMIATDPLLKNTKIIYYGFPFGEIYGSTVPKCKNLAICNDDYMYDMRKFLKSDERLLGSVLYHMKANPKEYAIIHYFTESSGFTLCDLVSYDRKHNEDNGENNLDGNPYNASWNCGVEGPTKKKAVLELRAKQMKNAVLLHLFTQSTPLIFSGDEFGNSQKGNNNAYCQDNPVSWLNWNDIDRNKEFYTFFKDVLAFRKEHTMLHMSKEYTMLDEKAYGYPDLSYHSEEPWKCSYDDLTRHFAMMYCGNYSEDTKEVGTFIYFAANMHWIPHEFALPKLPKGIKWYSVYDTDKKKLFNADSLKQQDKVTVSERSICVLLAK